MSAEEEARLAREIPEILQEIRLRKGRRYAEGPRGRLWVKRMIRESLAHGGVPFSLPMKQRRPRAPRVILLVDVSWSVARAAGLFLLIARGLGDRLRRVELFLFVDRLVEATGAFRRWASGRTGAPAARPVAARGMRLRRRPGAGVRPGAGGLDFASWLESLPGLDLEGASDYGRVFFQARPVIAAGGGRDTLLVVLGDARSNRREPLSWAFEEIASRCRRVLWLDPEPRREWNAGDSVLDAYAGACDVVCEVRDLDGLARGAREILRVL